MINKSEVEPLVPNSNIYPSSPPPLHLAGFGTAPSDSTYWNSCSGSGRNAMGLLSHLYAVEDIVHEQSPCLYTCKLGLPPGSRTMVSALATHWIHMESLSAF